MFRLVAQFDGFCADKPYAQSFLLFSREHSRCVNVVFYHRFIVERTDIEENAQHVVSLAVVLTEDMDNRNNTVYSLDYAVVKASIALSLTDPNDLFVYYYPVMDIKREMKFEAELNLNIDKAKTSLVDPVKKVKVTSPKVAASFIETSGALVAIAPVSLSTMTMSGEQSVEYYKKHQQTKESGVVTW